MRVRRARREQDAASGRRPDRFERSRDAWLRSLAHVMRAIGGGERLAAAIDRVARSQRSVRATRWPSCARERSNIRHRVCLQSLSVLRSVSPERKFQTLVELRRRTASGRPHQGTPSGSKKTGNWRRPETIVRALASARVRIPPMSPQSSSGRLFSLQTSP